jgi:hypothetical protein
MRLSPAMVAPTDFRIEPVWLLHTQTSVQTLCGELSHIEINDIGSVLDEFTRDLGTPPCRVHAAILSTLLIEVCRGVIGTLHRNVENTQ